jgi:hypothetical protein
LRRTGADLAALLFAALFVLDAHLYRRGKQNAKRLHADRDLADKHAEQGAQNGSRSDQQRHGKLRVVLRPAAAGVDPAGKATL